MTQPIRHKRPDCRSRRSWQHVWGARYCSVCWPCTDPTAIARELPAAAGNATQELPFDAYAADSCERQSLTHEAQGEPQP